MMYVCIIPPDDSIHCRESMGYEIFKNILKFIFSKGRRENPYFAKVRHQANKTTLAMTCLIKNNLCILFYSRIANEVERFLKAVFL